MTTLNSNQITELLEGERRSTKDKPWACPKCHKWTTSQAAAKFHKCKSTAYNLIT